VSERFEHTHGLSCGEYEDLVEKLYKRISNGAAELRATRAKLELAKTWLAERDRCYKADVPDCPKSTYVWYAKKVDEAREAFRAALKETEGGEPRAVVFTDKPDNAKGRCE